VDSDRYYRLKLIDQVVLEEIGAGIDVAHLRQRFDKGGLITEKLNQYLQKGFITVQPGEKND
jgi:hypothetical protein